MLLFLKFRPLFPVGALQWKQFEFAFSAAVSFIKVIICSDLLEAPEHAVESSSMLTYCLA